MPDPQNPQVPPTKDTNEIPDLGPAQPDQPAPPAPPAPTQPPPAPASAPPPSTVPPPPEVPSGGNNSGMGSGSPVPPGVDGWGWGPFLLTWIWGVSNKVWLSLLVFLPIPFVPLIMQIVLGINGRKWAWQNKKWDSVEQFNATQRRWSIWGLVLFVGAILSIVVLVLVVVFAADPIERTVQSDYNSVNAQVREAGNAVTDCIEDQTSKGTPTSTIYSDTELDLATRKGGCANSSNLLRGDYLSSITSSVKIKSSSDKVCVYKETIGSSGYASYDSSEGVVVTAPNGTAQCR